MRKTIFTLFVLMAAFSTGTVAQTVQANPLQTAGQAVARGVKANIEADEHLMGFYLNDELPSELYGMGNPLEPGDMQAGAIFGPDVIDQNVGGTITGMRFGLCAEVGASCVYVYSVDESGNPADLLASASLDNTVIGWNEARFSAPVTIEPDRSYFLAFDYNQSETAFPLAVDVYINPGNGRPGGYMLNPGSGWVAQNPYYGNLCIQAFVRGGDFVTEDLAMGELSSAKFVKRGDALSYSFPVRSVGTAVPTDYVLSVSLDGRQVQTLKSPADLTLWPEQTVTGSLDLDADLANGRHTLEVSVAEIGGIAPERNTDDDVCSTVFSVYENSIDRQKNLIEHFTSQYCTHCPLGYAVLNAMMGKRDDLVWVSLHNDMSGTDEYTLEDNAYITFFSASGYPSASFNRYFNNKYLGMNHGYLAFGLSFSKDDTDIAADYFSGVVDASHEIPAFASVDIAAEYDRESRNLGIKVSGNGVDNARTLSGDAVLTVYVTEDGLVSKQYDQGTWNATFNHSHVLRQIVSAPLGDAVNWTSESAYENDYTLTVPEEWNDANLNVVAFISTPIVWNGEQFATTIDNAFVYNANELRGVGNLPDGTASAKTVVGSVETARYSLDGRRVSMPSCGLNLVRMSDGSVRKVVVR